MTWLHCEGHGSKVKITDNFTDSGITINSLLSETVLHYMTLEWPKYKTAKPPLYTVYRTRNWKQLGRKWSREEMSFETVPKAVSIEAEVMSGCRLFQRRIPATESARSPAVDSCVYSSPMWFWTKPLCCCVYWGLQHVVTVALRVCCSCVLDECVQLESKCRAEMDEHRQKIDREFDALLAGHSREIDALCQRHVKERERQQKMSAAVEARRRRHLQQQQETDMKQFLAQQKKDYTKWKDELRKVLS